MPSHSSITDPNLHEPKGIAAASDNQIYVSNGAGSGAWEFIPQGWALYEHSGAAQVFNTTPAKLAINGSGANNNVSYLPPEIRGSGALWSTANNKITPIRAGDSYIATLVLPVTAKATAPNNLDLQLDIGGGVSPSNVIFTQRFVTTDTPSFTLRTVIPFHVLATFVTNGGQIFLDTDVGTVDITNPSILIQRINSGAF